MDKSQERESRLPYKEDVCKPAYFRKNFLLHVEQSLYYYLSSLGPRSPYNTSLFIELDLICLNEMIAKLELHSNFIRSQEL